MQALLKIIGAECTTVINRELGAKRGQSLVSQATPRQDKVVEIELRSIATVADLDIQKGGFSHWRAKRVRKFLGCHAHFRSRWKSKMNISKQL